MTTHRTPPASAEARFRHIFCHLDAIARYAARRGSRDPEGIAAETMTIAWRKLPAVPADDPRPWLFMTARHLLMAERRRGGRQAPLDPEVLEGVAARPVESGDPEVTAALMELSPNDREALVLIAWDDLTPAQAAASLGIRPVAFRVRLLRARRRFGRALEARASAAERARLLEMESA